MRLACFVSSVLVLSIQVSGTNARGKAHSVLLAVSKA